MTTPLDPDAIHRTVLLSVMDGSATSLDDAVERHGRTGITLAADTATTATHEGQAALLTATATAVRAFGTVHVHLDDPDRIIQSGPMRARSVGTAVTAQGATFAGADHDADPPDPAWPVIVIGATTPAPTRIGATAPALRAWWDGWTAQVTPADHTPHERPADNCVLAAIAAAGLAVAEAFGATLATPGSDAGYRTVALDLWAPTGNATTSPPPFAYAPHAWWLVGLGHLGQAFAWTISWLPYKEPAAVEIIGQDTQTVTESNFSTGMLTSRDDVGARKTRLVATHLETAGFRFQIVERRLTSDLRAQDAERHVALLGVDNLESRRLISDVGWATAIDVGLGATAADYTAIALHRFPGERTSDQIPAWQTNSARVAIVPPDTPALRDVEAHHGLCGVIELAGRAVGAAFVGVVASCLAVAEASRELVGGPGYDVLHLDLSGEAPIAAPADAPADVISSRLIVRP